MKIVAKIYLTTVVLMLIAVLGHAGFILFGPIGLLLPFGIILISVLFCISLMVLFDDL